MIYGAILKKGEKYYTNLCKTFNGISNVQTEYNWLITDCECYPNSPHINKLLSQKYSWLSGNEITSIVNKENFQWIWAVLSGFKKNIPLKDVLKYPLPYADGYKGFWKNPISIQHPLASIEIVPWDSSLTLVISDQKEIIDTYRRAFPLSEDLTSYNKKPIS